MILAPPCAGLFFVFCTSKSRFGHPIERFTKTKEHLHRRCSFVLVIRPASGHSAQKQTKQSQKSNRWRAMGSRLEGSRGSSLEKGLAEPAAEAERRADSRTAHAPSFLSLFAFTKSSHTRCSFLSGSFAERKWRPCFRPFCSPSRSFVCRFF